MEISVIVPVYDAEPWLVQALESALMQPETAEVILVEDGSGDASLEICHEMASADPRVIVLRHRDRKNHGASECRNLGIRHASCDYVAFLDADDYYLPGRFSEARKLLGAFPTADGVYDACGFHFDTPSDQEGWHSSGMAPRSQTLATVSGKFDPDELFEALLLGGYGNFNTDSIVVKRSLFDRTGWFDETLRFHEDTSMWIRMAAIGKLLAGRIDAPVAMTRKRLKWDAEQYRTEIAYYRKMLFDGLCDWGRDVGLSAEQMNLLYFRRWVESLFDYDSITRARYVPKSIRQVPMSVAFLIKQFARRPYLILSPHLGRFVAHNWKRLADSVASNGAGKRASNS